jgi:hypothetical protein
MSSEPAADTGSIKERIQAAIDEAHAICDQLGSGSQECAVAWDVVEELQAESSHQKQVTAKTPFQAYCDANPDADECRIYED